MYKYAYIVNNIYSRMDTPISTAVITSLSVFYLMLCGKKKNTFIIFDQNLQIGVKLYTHRVKIATITNYEVNQC